MKKLFLHCCCGPCSAGALPQFQALAYDPFCWFWNPNIQPYTEHKARRLAFIELMEAWHIPYEASKDYPLEEWLQEIAPDPGHRCNFCYRLRLTAAASRAAELGFPYYSTTLLISPYQQHELIRSLGEVIGADYGVQFAYLDLRPEFRAGQEAAREMGLYMQKYCGCIYSEKERYIRLPKEKK